MALEGPLAGVTLTLRLDGLSAFFILVIAAIGAVTTVYAIGHTRHERSFPGSALVYALFIASMLGVVVAGDAFTFLLAWETMSLASFALVLTDHRREAVRQAALAYVVTTQRSPWTCWCRGARRGPRRSSRG